MLHVARIFQQRGLQLDRRVRATCSWNAGSATAARIATAAIAIISSNSVKPRRMVSDGMADGIADGITDGIADGQAPGPQNGGVSSCCHSRWRTFKGPLFSPSAWIVACSHTAEPLRVAPVPGSALKSALKPRAVTV